jgi:hypothetical protein
MWRFLDVRKALLRNGTGAGSFWYIRNHLTVKKLDGYDPQAQKNEISRFLGSIMLEWAGEGKKGSPRRWSPRRRLRYSWWYWQ